MISQGPQNSAARGEDLLGFLSPGRFAGLLGLLIVVCFPLVFLGLEAFAYMDSGQFAYPVAFYQRESFWRGEIPLWNPLSSCGIPFLAQWNTLTLYPPALFYLLLPVPWSFGVFCLGHLFLGGMGMYLLAERWTHHRLAAAVAGVVFAFNGFSWYSLMWPHLLAGMAWMPWVVLAMQLAWSRGRVFILLGAVASALQLLSGGVEAILQTWMLVGSLWVWQLFAKDVPPGKMAVRSLAAGVLAAGLAAAQLLPFFDLLSHSQRGASYASGGMAGIACMPMTGWMNYLVPLFHCAPNANGVFVQVGQSLVGSYYLGVGTVALATLALWRARTRLVWILVAWSLLGLLMALGPQGGFYEVLKRLVPLFGFIRFPAKFLMLVMFTLPLLAAFGLKWFTTLPASDSTRSRRSLSAVGLGLLGLMAGILLFARLNPLPDSSLAVTVGNACGRALFLILILACLFGLRSQAEAKLQKILQIGLIVVLWFDVFTHSSNLSPAVPSSAWEPGTIRQFFNWDSQLAAGRSRTMQGKDSLWQMLAFGSPDLQKDLTTRRLSQFMNLNLLEGVPKFDGFYSLDLKNYLDVFKQSYFTTNDASKLKDFLGISQISNPTNVVDWAPRDSALPLVTGGQEIIFANDSETLEGILGNAFDPLHKVYLPLEAKGRVTPHGPDKVRTGPVQFSSHHLRMEIEADAPSILVVAQAFYHPWHAYVDGVSVPLWRANHAFQALEIPTGKHEVRLSYEDAAWFWGVLISSLSLLTCGSLWLYWRRPRNPV